MRRTERILLPVFTALLLILLWHAAVVLTHATIFPSPIAVARAMRDLLDDGRLWRFVRDSLFRVGSGYGLALFCGIPLGMLMGWYGTLNRIVNPVLQMLRPISPLAWMPLAVIWFGVSNAAPIFLIFLASVFPIVVATANGVRGVPRMYVQAAQNFGLSSTAMFRRVIFPAILPRVLIGLRVALGIAWLVLVAAEMIAVDSGLGYLIIDARNAGKRYDLVVSGMILIGLIGLALDTLIRTTENLQSVQWGFRKE